RCPLPAHHRQLQVRAGKDLLLGSDVVLRLRRHDVWDKGLRVAVVERKPCALHLDHDAVSGPEHMVRGMKAVLVLLSLVGRNRLWMLEAPAIAPAKDLLG